MFGVLAVFLRFGTLKMPIGGKRLGFESEGCFFWHSCWVLACLLDDYLYLDFGSRGLRWDDGLLDS